MNARSPHDNSASTIIAKLLIALGGWVFLIALATALLGGGQ